MAQWVGFCSFTAGAKGSILIRELGSHKPCGVAKRKTAGNTAQIWAVTFQSVVTYTHTSRQKKISCGLSVSVSARQAHTHPSTLSQTAARAETQTNWKAQRQAPDSRLPPSASFHLSLTHSHILTQGKSCKDEETGNSNHTLIPQRYKATPRRAPTGLGSPCRRPPGPADTLSQLLLSELVTRSGLQG